MNSLFKWSLASVLLYHSGTGYDFTLKLVALVKLVASSIHKESKGFHKIKPDSQSSPTIELADH